jgi:DNA-binding winged helix-turn-helix (wHTH) protein
MRLEIGDAVLDTGRRELLRAGAPVHLSPKAYKLLVLLVERRPQAVSRDEIQEALWPKTFVAESNLRTLVTEVRDALLDDGRRPLFIRTVHGFGYAFHGTAKTTDESAPGASPRARAVVHRHVADQDVDLVEGAQVLGRDSEADVWLGDDSISRRHALIETRGESVTVRDLGSKNGTFVNGARVTAAVPLASGDELRLGSMRFTFRSTSALASTKTQASTQGASRPRG